MKLLLGCVIFCQVFLFANQLFATETPGEEIKQLMTEKGFENLGVQFIEEELYITFESNIYRFETRAIAELINEIKHIDLTTYRVHILPQYQQRPVSLITIEGEDLWKFGQKELSSEELIENMEITMNTDKSWSHFSESTLSESALWKFDFAVGPGLKYLLGNYNNPVRTQIDLIPELRMSFSKGLHLKAQMIIPIQNDLNDNTNVRPGIVSLTQDIRLEENVFLSASAGLFDYNRAGLHTDFRKYFSEGKFSLNLQLGYTVYTEITGANELSHIRSTHVVDDNYLVAVVGGEYLWELYDLTIAGSFGNFLFQDPSVRFDVFRQFYDVKLGFYAVYNLNPSSGVPYNDEYNGGFYIRIPLPPSKYGKHRRLRLRVVEHFDFTYNAIAHNTNGRLYQTGMNLVEKMEIYRPSVIKNSLNKYLE